MREATPHEKHVAHMTKVLSEKYNIAPRAKAREQPQTIYFFSQASSPKKKQRSSLKSKEETHEIVTGCLSIEATDSDVPRQRTQDRSAERRLAMSRKIHFL